MLTRIREILLTQYIGAIVTALLVLDVISAVVQLIAQSIAWQFARGNSVIAERLSPRITLVPSGVRAALYAIAAYLLIRWLYTEKPEQNAGFPAEEGGDGSQ
jgi:hypothetical protein